MQKRSALIFKYFNRNTIKQSKDCLVVLLYGKMYVYNMTGMTCCLPIILPTFFSGTNDNEASNDLKLRNGSVVQQISTFVNGYEITNAPGCKHRPGRRKTRGVCSTTQKTHLCKNLFQKGDSPLAPCFPFINPGQYKVRL